MHKMAYRRYKLLLQQLETDGEYLQLEKELQNQEASFQTVIKDLDKEQRGVIMGYFGICSEMAERAVELACFIQEGE